MSKRVWADLSPEAERGLKIACRSLNMTSNQVIQQAVAEFLKHRGLLPSEEPSVATAPRQSRGVAEMSLAREPVR